MSNNLVIRGRLWLASDIHLGPDCPETARAFYSFLEHARDNADALVLCGDIFEAWIGDDQAEHSPPAWLAQALHHLRLTAHHLPLWIGRGNRDFLMGSRLMLALGAHLLPDRVVIDTDAGPLLLSHGDDYCTDDRRYQQFRRWVRTPWVQRIFLALPLPLRRNIAARARARSRQATHRKMANLLDVNPNAVAKAFQDTAVQWMVHGHTHRPARHRLTVQGRECTRIVLPDWDYDHAPTRGGWASVGAGGITLHTYTSPG